MQNDTATRRTHPVSRPTACPSCESTQIHTVAKTISVTTVWRCRDCDETWSIAGRAIGREMPRDGR